MKEIMKGVWKYSFGTPEKHTPTSMHRHAPKREAIEALPASALPFGAERIDARRTARGVTITLPMQASEDIFGFGLQMLSTNYAGRKRYIKVNSDPKMDTGEGHAPAPFYVTTGGYGVFVDTFRYATFSMGTNARRGASSEMKAVNQTHREFSESALYAFKRAKEERCVVIDVPAAQGVDVYFFAGNIREAVQRYILFSGGGCLPPMWGLGMWYRMYGGCDQEKFLTLAERFRNERMPIDVLGVEPGWHSHSYSCTYEWSYLFPQPQRMIDAARAKGYHLNLWEHAFVYPAAPIYDRLLPYSGDYEVWNGLVPDLGSEEARKIFTDWHDEHFVQAGITGFKLDECDNSDYNASNWSFPDATQFPSGMDGEQMHNAIGVLYQQMMDDMFRQRNIRTYSQVRSSGALAAPLPFVLYSDLYHHKAFIRAMVTAPFSGILWAPEVRSCQNGNDLLRRVQTVIFSNHALLNCWRIPNPPWVQVDVKLNLEGVEMENAAYYQQECRRLFELRMALLPYLYSAYAEYYLTGLPPVRHLAMDYPQDAAVRAIDTQFMFGKDLMVCPLTLEDGTERQVYLPQGVWYDFFTGERLEGGREMTVHADWNQIPVFVRANALVPLAKPVQHVAEDTVFELDVRAFGDQPAVFTLYEDDFVSLDYEHQGLKPIPLHYANGRVTGEGLRDSKKYRLCD